MKTTSDSSRTAHEPWNKGKLIGQKPPLTLHEIWTVRTQLRMTGMRFPNQKSSRFSERCGLAVWAMESYILI